MNGVLPTRGSMMLDIVFVMMFVLVIFLSLSIWMVRRKRFAFHRNLQLGLAAILIVAIVAFEIDVRFFTNWVELARPSPFFESGLVHLMLGIHLVFAIPVPFLWATVIWLALRNFPRPLEASEYSRKHRFWGRLAALFMILTATTGCVFYWIAFVA